MKNLYRGLLLAIWGVGLNSASWGQCFNQTTNVSLAVPPVSVVTGDFDGDGKLDIATSNLNSNTVSVLLNLGSGLFKAPASYLLDNIPTSLAVGDFNADGKLDLVTSNKGGGIVSVLLNNGSGGFGLSINYSAGIGNLPNSIAVGDVNADNNSDVVTANYEQGTVTVLLGNGSGGIGFFANFRAGETPGSVALSDLNADGKLDVAVGSLSRNTVSVLIGVGNGVLSDATSYSTSVYSNIGSVVSGDFNGDSKPDLAAANIETNAIEVLPNNGIGGFGTSITSKLDVGPEKLTVGDFNGDGKLDLVTLDYFASTINILTNTGNGRFTRTNSLKVTPGITFVTVSDIDADGKPDLVVSSAVDKNVSILLNCTSPASPPTPTGLTLAQPTYDCTTGLLSLSATGGNGQPVEYRIAGVRDWSASNTFTVPSYQRNNTTFNIEARQTGAISSLAFTTTCQAIPPPVNPPVTPPTGLSVSFDTFICNSGELTLTTSGGNGQPIEYRIAGLRDWSSSNVFVVPSYQRFQTPFNLEARQSGQVASRIFVTFCLSLTPTTPPTTPPTGTPLSVTTLSFDCQSGALQLATAGGDGNPVDFKVPGLRDYANSPSFSVPAYQRTNTSFTLYARQSGREVTTTYTAGCPLAARLASPETTSAFNVVVYPNPVGEQFNVGVSGAAGQSVRFHLTNISGQTVLEQRAMVESDAHTETLQLPTSGAGLYLLQVSTPGQSRTVKVLKP